MLSGKEFDAIIEQARCQGYKQAIADAKEKVNAYATIWMSFTDDMSKEQIADEALKSAKSAMIRILDSLG